MNMTVKWFHAGVLLKWIIYYCIFVYVMPDEMVDFSKNALRFWSVCGSSHDLILTRYYPGLYWISRLASYLDAVLSLKLNKIKSHKLSSRGTSLARHIDGILSLKLNKILSRAFVSRGTSRTSFFLAILMLKLNKNKPCKLRLPREAAIFGAILILKLNK